MRTSAIIRIIANLVLVIFLVALFVNLLNGDTIEFKGLKIPTINFGGFSYKFDDESKYSIADGKINTKNINKLDIDWISGKIKIEEYSGDGIEFYEESSSSLSEDKKMRYMIDNGTLRIRFRKPYKTIGAFDKALNKTLVIRIPKSMEDGLTQLKIENVSSIIDINALIADNVIIDNVSGQINIKDLIANKLDVETVSGSVYAFAEAKSVEADSVSASININLESNSIEKIDVETVSGSIVLNLNSVPSEIDAETVSGSINVKLPENDGFVVKYSSISGKFNTDFEVKLTKGEAIYKDGKSSNIKIDTISGSINVNKK